MHRISNRETVEHRRARLARNRATTHNSNTNHNLCDIFNFDEGLFTDFANSNADLLSEVNNHNIKSPIEQLNNDLKNNQNWLRAAHINARSIPGHILELSRIISETTCDVIGVSETFIKDDTPLNRCNIENYNLFTENRTHTTQGGVAYTYSMS